MCLTQKKKYLRLHDDADKYKKFLSMYNDYLFDYDISTGIISIYVYRSMKATVIKKCILMILKSIL